MPLELLGLQHISEELAISEEELDEELRELNASERSSSLELIGLQ